MKNRSSSPAPQFVLAFLVMLAGFAFTLPVLAKPFDCAHNNCGLLARGNNPDLVIGTVEAVATPEQMKTVFHWARAHGYWKDLPADGKGYLKFVKLLSLSVPSPSGPRSVTVFMTREEFDSAPQAIGALARYSPHDAAHDAITYPDPTKQAYWVLVGCVAQLCAPEDKACPARYRTGRFARHTGVQLQVDTGQPMQDGLVVDPLTLFPVQTKETKAPGGAV